MAPKSALNVPADSAEINQIIRERVSKQEEGKRWRACLSKPAETQLTQATLPVHAHGFLSHFIRHNNNCGPHVVLVTTEPLLSNITGMGKICLKYTNNGRFEWAGIAHSKYCNTDGRHGKTTHSEERK